MKRRVRGPRSQLTPAALAVVAVAVAAAGCGNGGPWTVPETRVDDHAGDVAPGPQVPEGEEPPGGVDLVSVSVIVGEDLLQVRYHTADDIAWVDAPVAGRFLHLSWVIRLWEDEDSTVPPAYSIFVVVDSTIEHPRVAFCVQPAVPEGEESCPFEDDLGWEVAVSERTVDLVFPRAFLEELRPGFSWAATAYGGFEPSLAASWSDRAPAQGSVTTR